jgi:hypothetical protein
MSWKQEPWETEEPRLRAAPTIRFVALEQSWKTCRMRHAAAPRPAASKGSDAAETPARAHRA